MKKLMFAAAAAFCGTVFALESANVVGYQTKETSHGQFCSLVATFVPTGTDGSTMKLGDIKPANTTWDGSTLFFLNQYGGTDKFDHEAYGNVKKQFYYLNTTEADDFDCDPGWYHVTDELSEYPMNSVINIPAGAGFMIDAKDAGATLIVPAVLSQN